MQVVLTVCVILLAIVIWLLCTRKSADVAPMNTGVMDAAPPAQGPGRDAYQSSKPPPTAYPPMVPMPQAYSPNAYQQPPPAM